jgi:uncharacterized membrane protein
MSENKHKPDLQSLLVEYQAAQDSAQHHDNQVWTTTGIIWGAGLILIGFVVQSIGDARLKLPVVAVCILAILMLIYLWVMAFQLNSVKNQKYTRCKEIESILNLEQHTRLRYKKRSGRFFYSLVMVVFIGTWISVLITALLY